MTLVIDSPAAAQEERYLRDLAKRVRDIAHEPVMNERRAAWRKHNALAGERPMVLCFPEGAWLEMLPEESQRCTDKLRRQIERQLLQKIYWWEHLNDDNTVEPFLDLNWKVSTGTYGVEIPYHHGEHRGSYVWDAPVQDLDRDLAKLRHREPSVDREGTRQMVEEAAGIVGEVLPVRLRGGLWWTVGLTWDAIKLMGLENLMMAMYDQPEGLHRLMGFLRDDMLRLMKWTEAEGLLTRNDEAADGVGSGGVGAVDGLRAPEDRGPVTLRQRWGFAESQETVGVSPRMFEEFILPYQAPLAAHFGLNCYGCCEPLELRIEAVMKQIPRLRRVSVAPMANLEMMAQKLGDRYIYSRKPNPAHVCVGFDEAAIRQDLRRSLAAAGKGTLELIMKDTHTVETQTWRIGRWVRIAREEIDRYLEGRP